MLENYGAVIFRVEYEYRVRTLLPSLPSPLQQYPTLFIRALGTVIAAV